MTSVSNSNSSEGIYKSLQLPEKSTLNKTQEKIEDNISQKQIKTSKDNINIPKEAKSTSIISLHDEPHTPNTNKLESIKKDLMSGKDVNIKYSDFPGMSKEQVVKALFPDAKEISTKAKHPFIDSDYSAKAGNIHTNELVGGFMMSDGFNIKVSKLKPKETLTEQEVPIELKPFPDIKEKIELKPFPSAKDEDIKIGDKPDQKEKKYIGEKLNELKSKGEVYIEHTEMGTKDTKSQIEKMFPGAKISESTYERPSVYTNFTDKDGNNYKVENVVDGFIASRGINIKKL